MTGYLPSASLPPAETGGHKLLHTALAACLLRLMYGATAIKSCCSPGHSLPQQRRDLSADYLYTDRRASAGIRFLIFLMRDDARRLFNLLVIDFGSALIGTCTRPEKKIAARNKWKNIPGPLRESHARNLRESPCPGKCDSLSAVLL